MYQHTDHRTLVSRGRKAGLNTRELYSALAARPEETTEQISGLSDCNGYVSAYNVNGHRVFEPLGSRPRP